MDGLTSTFNAAVGGPSGEAGAITSGPNPTGPDTPGTAAEASTTSVHSPESQSAATSEFAQSAPTAPRIQPEPSREFTLDRAEAELDMLEGGRAKPAARHNLNPPPKLKKIVDSTIERQREARIGALKAYMDFRQRSLDRSAEHDHKGDLDLCL